MPLIRSISGLRATLGDSLTASVIVENINALMKIIPQGTVVIARDGRPSGKWIEKIVAGTLQSAGFTVISLGIAPTPTVQLLTESSKSVCGIAITASHNPEIWNGLKFINSSGVFFNQEENQALSDALENPSKELPRIINPPDIMPIVNCVDIHCSKVLELPIFKNKYFFEKCGKRKLKVVVDAVNCSGSEFIPALLERLKCEVVRLYCDGTGIFPHIPEPLPENLTSLSEAVRRFDADLGIAVDPDADRLVLVDENGDTVSEEMTIALASDAVLQSKAFDSDSKSIVINYSTTRLVEDIAKTHNAKTYRSPVGEINVVSKMKELGAIIGGEGSGGVILPACHYGRDSLVATALVIYLLIQKKRNISEIVKDYPKYFMTKKKIDFAGDFEKYKEEITQASPNATISYEDGVHLNFSDYMVHIRKSNTEPILRIITEAPSDAFAKELSSKYSDFFS
ncbi:MAG: phosphoglucosamine mutase [Ignavibacteria bacterium]|nr:phosphoglucosamine mutase [Ignavibacteria bacterium]